MFFDQLEQLCARKGVSVSALLDSLGISRSNITRWKKGTKPKPPILKKIAEALDVDVSVFFVNAQKENLPAQGGGEYQIKHMSDVKVRVMSKIPNIDDETAYMIEKIIDKFEK